MQATSHGVIPRLAVGPKGHLFDICTDMTEFFLQLIGVGNEITSHVDEVEWGWTHPACLWLLLPAAGAGVFMVWLHRRNMPHIAPVPRQILSACRIAVLVLLVVVLAGPAVKLTLDEQKKPVLAVVVDESQSMTLPLGAFEDKQLQQLAQVADMFESDDDANGKKPLTPELRKQINSMSRLELADRVVDRRWADLFEPLGERFDFRTYRVAQRVRQVDRKDELTPPSESDCNATALGAAIDRVLDDTAGRTLAGLVLFSDGRSTAGPEPLGVIRQRAGRVDADRKPPCPMFVVPVGSVEPLPDVALLTVIAPGQVAVGDSVSIVATVGSHGFDGQKVTVLLMEGDQSIDETEISLDGSRRQRVELAFTATEQGDATRMLTVKVDPVAGEQVVQNNEQTSIIQVGNERLKLLYLEGTPRWDFCFLDHALRADHGLDVTVVMESQLAASGAAPDQLPTAAGLPEDPKGFAEFDTIILGDISPSLLPRRFAESLAKAVEEEGVGLIVQAGPSGMPHRFMGSPLARLLPFNVRPVVPDAPVSFDGATAEAFAPFRMAVAATGSIHPAFRLYDSATKNRRLWSRMPTFFWAADTGHATPGATVLATFESAQQSRPLIAEQFAGRGRVLMIGLDSTFLWRRNIGSHLFYRFWGQAIRHVARRSEREPNKSWLDVYPSRIEPGESVAVELYTVGEDDKPLENEQVTLEATAGAAVETVVLDRVDGQAGLFRGSWVPRSGDTVQLHFVDARDRFVAAVVQIASAGQEMLEPIVDRDALDEMARASGGAMIELDQIDRLPKRLEGDPVTEQREYSEEIWDNWLTLILLISIYCIDVGVRRLQGLT